MLRRRSLSLCDLFNGWQKLGKPLHFDVAALSADRRHQVSAVAVERDRDMGGLFSMVLCKPQLRKLPDDRRGRTGDRHCL